MILLLFQLFPPFIYLIDPQPEPMATCVTGLSTSPANRIASSLSSLVYALYVCLLIEHSFRAIVALY